MAQMTVKGEAAPPTGLCAAAPGSCIGMQLAKPGYDLTGMRIEVEKAISRHKPRRII